MRSPRAPDKRVTTTTLPHPPTTAIDTCLLIASPYGSDVRKLENSTTLTDPTHHTHLITRRLSQPSILKTSRQYELQNIWTAASSDLETTIPRDDRGRSGRKHHQQRSTTRTIGGGVPRGQNRRCSPAPGATGDQFHTISRLSELPATCTDDQYNTNTYHLPEGWTVTNDRGTIVTKRQL